MNLTGAESIYEVSVKIISDKMNNRTFFLLLSIILIMKL